MAILKIKVMRLTYCLIYRIKAILDLQGLRSGDFLLVVLKSLLTPQGVLSCLSPVHNTRYRFSSRVGVNKAVVALEPLSIEPCFWNSRSSGLESKGTYHLRYTKVGNDEASPDQ